MTTAESGTVGHAGGIAGSFNAGETLKDSVAVQRSITGLQGTDKIVGQLDDEAATNITGNLSWKGTALLGNEPIEQPIVWQDIYAEDLQSQETYEAQVNPWRYLILAMFPLHIIPAPPLHGLARRASCREPEIPNFLLIHQ